MSLDLSKLESVLHLPDGDVRARCPACAEGGGDAHGERHLLIRADGRYGCCANPGDKAHRRRVFQLAGGRSTRASSRGKGAQLLPNVRVLPRQRTINTGAVSIKRALEAPFSDVSDGVDKPLRVRVADQICTKGGDRASAASEGSKAALTGVWNPKTIDRTPDHSPGVPADWPPAQSDPQPQAQRPPRAYHVSR